MKPPFLTSLAASLALALSACAGAPTPPVAAHALAPLAAETDRAMVVAADPRAAEAGAEMLRAGGSATDAAIATMLALTVVEPQSSGIGGGGYYLRQSPKGAVETIDGRETAPAAATPARFLDPAGQPLGRRAAVESGLSVGVPGNIAMAAEAHGRAGRLPWDRLFAPAIRLAREGWTLSPRGRAFLDKARGTGARDAEARALYYAPNGEPLPVGALLRNPALAATFEEIAKGGAAAFYKGPLAQRIAAVTAADTPRDGTMTPADLAAYAARPRPALCGVYRLYRVCGMGPSSSGATVVIGVLGMLERFDMASLGPDSPVAWHLFAEAQRLAFADRDAYLADDAFVPVPAARLIDPAYLAARSALIAPDSTMARALPGLEAPSPPGRGPEEQGTTHIVALDAKGEAVSWTSTVEGPFGSGLMVGGFFLNNELTDFSFTPEAGGKPVANRVEGGKRPRSSIAPTLVYAPDGSLLMVLGAGGGATIPVQVARSIVGVIDWRLPVDRALALPLVFSPGDTLMVEQGSVAESWLPALVALGHKNARTMDVSMTAKTNAVLLASGKATGAADPRGEGRAVKP